MPAITIIKIFRLHLTYSIICNKFTIGFKSIYIHLESITACYGASVLTACVIDLGADTIKINCIDEGEVIPGTYVKKNFGGSDITQILSRVLVKKSLVTPLAKTQKIM